MSEFLDRVCGEKQLELALKKGRCPIAELERRAAARPARAFRDAIGGHGKIIAEIKRKSPRISEFRQNGDPGRLAAIYEAHGAAAISIVTDERNFGTSLTDVEQVRRAATLPVLVKDFVIDRYQVVEARAAGADAVLLIARILSPPTLSALLNLTRELGISALVECHDEQDITTAVAAGADVIGINNRDLATLTVSLATTRQLISQVPQGVLSVSESGIARRADIQALLPLGVNAFLIGGVLLSSADPGAKLQELLGHGLPPAEDSPAEKRSEADRSRER